METELTDEQIKELSIDLETLKESLRDLLELSANRAETVKLDQTLVGRVSRIDAIQQQQMAKANRQQYEVQLRQVHQALKRIEEDDYGYCRSCDEPIGYGRLKIRPETPLCIQCQSKSESS